MDKDYGPRLERIEGKLDKLADVVVGQARIEERMISLFKRMDHYDGKQERVIARLSEVERVTIGRGLFFRWLDRGALAAVGAAIALVFNSLKSPFG